MTEITAAQMLVFFPEPTNNAQRSCRALYYVA